MLPKTKWIAAGTVTVALLGAGTAVAAANANDDDREAPITGTALERASNAALEHTDGGRVTETETGDEDSLYEVEVTLDDGSQVDVQLNAQFEVVGSSADHEDANGDDDD